VFRHSGPFRTPPPELCSIQRFDALEQVAAATLSAIEAQTGLRSLATDRFELDHQAILWIAFIGDQPAGMLFCRQGGDFRKWFVPLMDTDIVLFRGRTFPEFRGRGVMPALISNAMHAMLRDGGAAYCDCRVYNTSSMRCITKAGFTRIATMRPISRDDALGDG
jgi:ribosomal protein S18 acetylase RimI-like enzyme